MGAILDLTIQRKPVVRGRTQTNAKMEIWT